MKSATQFTLALLLVGLLLTACSRSDAQHSAQQPPSAAALGSSVKLLATRLVSTSGLPVAMALAPDGRLFFTEREGNVQVMDIDEWEPETVISLPTVTAGERGMVGIALDPDFEQNHYIWIFHSASSEQDDGVVYDRVVRFSERDGIGTEPQIALTIPTPQDVLGLQIGGNLHFGPDGMLYLALGDHEDAANAQNPQTPFGKIHRFVPDMPLGIPDDNPFGESSVFAMGMRNPFDFTFDSASETLFATENGPGCDDEINLIVPGGSYGWQEGYRCTAYTSANPLSFSVALRTITPTEALTGITVYKGERFEELDGKLIICSYKSGNIFIATLNNARSEIVSMASIGLTGLANADCKTDVVVTPDGRVFFASNDGIFELESHQLLLQMDTLEVGGHVLKLTGENADLLRQSDMTWARLQYQWVPGSSGFDLFEPVNEIQSGGFKVLVSITGPYNPTEIDFKDFNRFIREVAVVQPDAIEIWEDMNLERAWPNDEISAEDYVHLMLAPAYQTIKEIDPNIMVISGGLAPTGAFGGCTPIGCDDSVYLTALIAADAQSFMDCAGVHIIAGATSPSSISGHPFDGNTGHYSWYFSGMADLYGGTFSKPLCFTSIGYLSAEGYGELGNGYLWAAGTTVEQQAQWLGESLVLARQAGNVRLFVVFNIDLDAYDSDSPWAGYAILRPDGTCPACITLAEAP